MDNSAIQEQECVSTFSLELKKLLEQADLTQLEFAHKIGVDKNSVNNWVKGRVQPKLYQLKLIIDFFLSNDKTRDFKPLQLFISGSVLNNPSSLEYEKAIRHIQEVYDLQLEEEKLKLENEYEEKLKKLQSGYDSILMTNSELSKRNYYLESTLESKQFYKRKLKELNEREKTYKREVREELVKRIVVRNVYPESTARDILRDKDIKGLIEKMYQYEKEHGLTDTYKKYFDELYNELIDTLEDELEDIIKSIYYPED